VKAPPTYNIVPIELQKKSSYQPKLIIGAMAPFSLQGNGVGYWIYSTGNITLPQTNTRLTAGISSGTKQIFGESATCFIGGIEQKINNDFSLIADWYSGNHAMGILAAGPTFTRDSPRPCWAGQSSRSPALVLTSTSQR
jgi:hypothetical protein